MSVQNETSRKKSLIRFWIIIIVSALIGGFTGFIGTRIEASMIDFLQMCRLLLLQTAPLVMICSAIIFICGSLWYEKQARKLFSAWDQENEAVYDLAEHKLSMAMAATNVGTIIHMVWFGFLILARNASFLSAQSLLIYILIFMVLTFVYVFLQRRFVEFTKEMYPGKKGDALDMDFQKQWINSMDEFEQQVIYKAAYKAYSAGQVLYLSILLVLFLGALFFDISVLPFLVVGVIWLIQSIIYLKEAIKSPKR